MQKFHISDIQGRAAGSILAEILPGTTISSGGVAKRADGEMSNAEDEGHVHDFPELFMILEGAGVVGVDGDEISVVSGDVILVEAGEVHHISARGGSGCVSLWLHLANKEEEKKHHEGR